MKLENTEMSMSRNRRNVDELNSAGHSILF